MVRLRITERIIGKCLNTVYGDGACRGFLHPLQFMGTRSVEVQMITIVVCSNVFQGNPVVAGRANKIVGKISDPHIAAVHFNFQSHVVETYGNFTGPVVIGIQNIYGKEPVLSVYSVTNLIVPDNLNPCFSLFSREYGFQDCLKQPS